MFGILFILAITVVIVLYFILRRVFNEDIAYMGVSIVPLSSLLAIPFGAFFSRMLGEGETFAIVFGLLGTSPVLGLIGLLMVVKSFQQGKYRVATVVATILAYLPLIVLIFPRET